MSNGQAYGEANAGILPDPKIPGGNLPQGEMDEFDIQQRKD
jgi:hypothetical protein